MTSIFLSKQLLEGNEDYVHRKTWTQRFAANLKNYCNKICVPFTIYPVLSVGPSSIKHIHNTVPSPPVSPSKASHHPKQKPQLPLFPSLLSSCDVCSIFCLRKCSYSWWLHLSGISQDVSLYVWLVWFSITFSKLIHVVAYIRVSFLLKTDLYSATFCLSFTCQGMEGLFPLLHSIK